MKAVLTALKSIVNIIFPKSKWGNVIYLILGFAISQFDAIKALIDSVSSLF